MSGRERAKRPTIAIVSSPTELYRQASESNIATLVDIVGPLSEGLYLIAGSSPYDDGRVRHIKVTRWRDREKDFIVAKLMSRLVTDLRLARALVSVARDVDVVLYYLGAKGFLISMATARLLGTRVAVCSFSSMPIAARSLYRGSSLLRDGAVPPAVLGFLERATFALAHRIWVESPGVVGFSGLGRYGARTSVFPFLYVDTSRYRPLKGLPERGMVIGYVGRLSEEKGVRELAAAAPMILERVDGARLFIFGDGPLRPVVEAEMASDGLGQRVQLFGEVPRESIPLCLNELALLVLPSHSEGLPNVVLEAMACGTPVVATPVGGVPDVIRDGETGFIVADGSPQGIARGVLRALAHPGLGDIAENARRLVVEEYAYQAVVEGCRRALDELF